MAIIAFAVFDTEENPRTEITKRCLDSFIETVNYRLHDIYLIDNNSCKETKHLIERYRNRFGFIIITNYENIGTAEAINLAWKFRKKGQHAMKIDNDVVWHQSGWVEMMEECITRDPNIGIIGLKRKDCWENVDHENPDYKSKLIQLPHMPGQRWFHVEQAKHIIGTCQMYNSNLLDKIGYLHQLHGVKYGHDDVLASWRSQLAGFKNVFLPQIEIDHIDPGGTPYQTWKEEIAREQGPIVKEFVVGMIEGVNPIYYNPYDL